MRSLDSRGVFSEALAWRATGRRDVVVLVAGQNRVPPNDPGRGFTVSDAFAMLRNFAGLPGQGGLPPQSRMDLLGVNATQVPHFASVIDVNDLTLRFDTFAGTTFRLFENATA